MKVFVIYNLIPEEDFHAVVEMTEEEYAFFSKAHNVFINLDTNEEEQEAACMVIQNAFCSNPEYKEYCRTDKEREYFGKWVSNPEMTDISEAEKLIFCGFVL